MKKLIFYASHLSLCLWFGAMVSLAFIYAPVVFKLSTSTELAGRLGQSMTLATAVLGMRVVVFALLCEVLLALFDMSLSQLFSLKVFFIVLTGLILLYEFRVLFPQMMELLARMGDIDKVAYSDPTRQAFRVLHRKSGFLFLANMALAAFAIFRDLNKSDDR